MNRRLLNRAAAAIMAIAALIGVRLSAEGPHVGRQHYGDWTYHAHYDYYSRIYYYRPDVGDADDRYHLCFYYPSDPRHVYYYNPYQKRYWGRLDTKGTPGHQYSLLAPADRKKELQDIPEKAFPEAKQMPPIPESKDGTRMEPVKDLPRTQTQGLPEAAR